MRALIVVAVLLAPLAGRAQGVLHAPVYHLPKLPGIRVDGSAAEWKDRAFRVEAMAAAQGGALADTDFDPVFQVAWDAEGLLLHATLRDDAVRGAPADRPAYEGDSIEIFLTPDQSRENFVHVVFAPGPAEEAPRAALMGFRLAPRADSAALQYAVATTATGWQIEARIPFSLLARAPRSGDSFGVQVYANDLDEDGTQNRFQAVWFPRGGTHDAPENTHRVRLARRASPPVSVAARASYDDRALLHFAAVGARALAGREIVCGGTAARFAPGASGRPEAGMTLPVPDWNEDNAFFLEVARAGKAAGHVLVPAPGEWRARLLMGLDVGFRPYVFTGTAFPKAEVLDRDLAARLLGAYSVNATFYNAKYQQVGTADTPGRYGAVIEISPATGRKLTRFRTICRLPEGFNDFAWWFNPHRASFHFPDAMEISDQVAADQANAIGRYVAKVAESACYDKMDSAILLAGLRETQPAGQPVPVALDPWAMDRQWWIGLKRILYWPDKMLDVDFVSPKKAPQTHAPELILGSETQAGMKPGTAAAIDTVLKQWTADTDEAFAVAVARKGVVFYQGAFGMRDGAPMTMETKSWMASISKLMSSTLMWMLVDQGLVDLDAPVDSYLPALRYIPVQTPLTVRDLYIHTSGLALGYRLPGYYVDHWGDDVHDLEEIIAGYYPYLRVGRAYGYNGTGLSLGGKILELLTDEALPIFFKNHLLDPLGMTHTEAVDASARTMSVPMDMARFGQMLLNRGAYGPYRFFSEETFAKVLPQPVKNFRDIPSDTVAGVGVQPMAARAVLGGGVSPNSFGHGAASGATFVVDPDNELIIVMTRNRAGKNHSKYHPMFIQAILSGLPEK
jgi:CubicO group peptidase (beta-lactamase class C family)